MQNMRTFSVEAPFSSNRATDKAPINETSRPTCLSASAGITVDTNKVARSPKNETDNLRTKN